VDELIHKLKAKDSALESKTEECAELRKDAWQPIDSAPKDGSEIIVYAPSVHGLPSMVSKCAWHPDAGFCIDELRQPEYWIGFPAGDKP
jgi:hypothetical protein